MARTVDVQILGRAFSFQLSGDVSPQEFLAVADYVEKKLVKIKSRMGETESFRLGLLVAVNIAQELFSLKGENEKLRSVLDRIDTLLSAPEASDDLAIRFTPKS